MNIDQIRREYLKGGLRREDLDSNPLAQFQKWLTQAIDSGLPDPTAMCLATVSAQGRPSQRIVLLKYFDERGLVFFTNYGSRKAKEIAANPHVSLHFPWQMFERQVMINGTAEKVSTRESVKYFLSRPKESQLGAWASDQSMPISSRMLLEQKFAEMKQKFSKGEIPVPSFWGGYRVIPEEFEFWQGGANRLHDRFSYQRDNQGQWRIERLAP